MSKVKDAFGEFSVSDWVHFDVHLHLDLFIQIAHTFPAVGSFVLISCCHSHNAHNILDLDL